MTYRIRTPENIELTFQLAGLGDRVLAQLIDLCITTSIFYSLWLLLGVLFLAGSLGGLNLTVLSESLSTFLVAMAIVASGLLNVAYYVYFELRWQGQTPGKRWSGLRVLRDNGQPLEFKSVLIRNIVRLVDQFFGLGLVVILCNAQEKRLGDFAAGTIVVKDSVRPALAPQIAIEALPFLNLSRLKPQDDVYLAEFLNRRDSLEDSARNRVAERLAQRYAELLEEPLPADSEAFLVRIYASYGQE
jgi:uncharacterized RDD family membrane protein YckC